MEKKVVVKGEEVKPQYVKQKISIKNAVAIADGYYKGAIIKAGQKFDFDGYAQNDGSVPHWIETPAGYKPKKAAVKKTEEIEEVEIDDSEREAEEELQDEQAKAQKKKEPSKAAVKFAEAKASVKNAVDHLV